MRIARNISWVFSANLTVSFTKWLTLVIIAKLLAPEDVGVYSLAFAISAPITLFANMKLRSLYITENEGRFSDYIYSRNILSLFSIIILLLVALYIYPQHSNVIILVGLLKILDLQSDLYYAVPHKDENMRYIAVLMISKHVITIFSFLISLFITKNLPLSLLLQFIIQFLFLELIEKKSIKRTYKVNRNPFIPKSSWRIILIGLPLGFVQMLFSFNTSYPRYLLEFFEDAEILGYFSAIAYILVIGNIMVNAVSQAFLPNLAKKIINKDYYNFKKSIFINLTIFSLVLGTTIIFLTYNFGEIFLSIAYGVEYAKYSDVLMLMSVALTINFLSWNFDTALLALRYISIQPKISIFILVLNLILGYLLIKDYGIYGAAYTIIITNSFQLLLRFFFVNSKVNSLLKNSFE